MKKFIFYAVALLSVASLLNGCKKDDGNESKGPDIEGVFWFEEEEDPAIGVMEGFYFKDGKMSYYLYAKSDEGAAMLSGETGKTVKKGNIVLHGVLDATIVKNEDGTSGTIKHESRKIEYSGLTENSVFVVLYGSEGNETDRLQFYTLEYLGFPVTGIVE